MKKTLDMYREQNWFRLGEMYFGWGELLNELFVQLTENW